MVCLDLEVGMFKKINMFRLWLSYKLSEIRNIYTHKAVGQQTGKDGETIILYTILGKRDLYKISIEKLMSDRSLLERFHPCQTAKFGAIALGEVLFCIPPENREQRFTKIKQEMLEENFSKNL